MFKSRSAKFYSNQVKVLLLIVIGVLFWNSYDARRFTAKMLFNASEMVEPKPQTFGQTFDRFFSAH